MDGKAIKSACVARTSVNGPSNTRPSDTGMASKVDDGHGATGEKPRPAEQHAGPQTGETYGRGSFSLESRENSKILPYHKLSNVDASELLHRYINGETIPELSLQLGCDKAAVSRLLRRHAGAEWPDAKESHYECLLDDGLNELRSARNDLNLARAQEAYLRRIEWRASVEHPRWQQQKQQINVSGNQVNVQLVSFDPVDNSDAAALTVDNSIHNQDTDT